MRSLAKLAAVVLCASGLSLVAAVSEAADVGQHPAVFAPRTLSSIDTNLFRPGHPASPTMRGTHANHEHPALRQASPGIDTNHFLVQPPASVQWEVQSPSVNVAGQPSGTLAN